MSGAENSLDASTAVSLLDRVSDGVIVLDRDLRYTFVNEAAEQLIGSPREALLGELIWDLFPASAATEARDRIEAVLSTGEPQSYERYNAEVEHWVRVEIAPLDAGLCLVFRDVSDEKSDRRKLDRILETTPVGVLVLDTDGSILRANARGEELLDLERAESESRAYRQPELLLRDEDGVPIPTEDHPVTLALETAEPVLGETYRITFSDGPERWLSTNCAPVLDDEGEPELVVVAIEDVTGLKRLERFIEVFGPVDDRLNHASTRDELDRDACRLLAETSIYDVAWIVHAQESTSEPTLSACASSLDVAEGRIGDALRADDTVHSSITRALTAQRVEVLSGYSPIESTPDRATDDDGPDAGRLALVPLVHGADEHGVLGLYSARSEPFGDRERQLLAALGERIGRVHTALATRALLHADSVTELTFRSTDRNSVLIRLSAELDCDVRVEETIPVADDSLLLYLTVTGVPAADFCQQATDEAVVRRARVVSAHSNSEGGRIELEASGRSLAQALVEEHAMVTTDRVAHGEATVVCDVAADRDIGALVDRVTEAFPDSDLVAKRDHEWRDSERSDRPPVPLDAGFESRLTAHQRRALRAAFHAGYFRSPRRSSATEIAAALSITQPTFSYHLRNAQQAAFERLFEQS